LSQAPQDDLPTAVLIDYCEALRDVLRAEGISPFKLAGLNLYDELQHLERSLRRCQKKKDIVSCLPCWNSRTFAINIGDPILN